MNSKRFLLFVCFTLFVCHSLQAQVENESQIDEIVESVAEKADENYDYSELFERLNHYKKHPLNLNKVTRSQLNELLFLSPVQINNIISHREITGPYINILELQAVEGMDMETVRTLLPFVTLNPALLPGKLTSREMLAEGENDLMIRFGEVLQKQKGFSVPDTMSHYLGTPQRIFTRYRYNFQDRISAGLTMEKDAGESFFAGRNKYGFDFYSGFLAIKSASAFSKIVVGDYSLQLGQGLTLWSGLSFGKGPVISTVVKPDIGLQPYRSSNESLFFRGIASTVNFHKFSFTPFVSLKDIDASLNPDVGSVSLSGYHRTTTETANKNSVRELVYGSDAQFRNRGFTLGAVAYHTRFSRIFSPGDPGYNQFKFSGQSLTNLGFYYNYNWRNIYFSGEASHSLNGGSAYLASAIISLSNQVSAVILSRNYQKDYHSFYTSAIAESSISNEKGTYAGLMINPNPKLEFTAYADVFHFPWLKFGVDAPSKGYELLSQLTFSPGKYLKAYFRYKRSQKEENDEEENTINFLEEVRKQNFRTGMDYSVHPALSLRNRIEMTQYKKGSSAAEYGYLIYQDLIYHPLRKKWSVNARFGLFDTQSFNSAIYTYENDVLYSFSAPGFQNQGIRFYINGRYKVKKGIDIWLRYAITRYTNTDEIGSGLDLIEGSKKSEVKAQIRFQF